MKYRVVSQKINTSTYEVEASSEDEALQLVQEKLDSTSWLNKCQVGVNETGGLWLAVIPLPEPPVPEPEPFPVPAPEPEPAPAPEPSEPGTEPQVPETPSAGEVPPVF